MQGFHFFVVSQTLLTVLIKLHALTPGMFLSSSAHLRPMPGQIQTQKGILIYRSSQVLQFYMVHMLWTTVWHGELYVEQEETCTSNGYQVERKPPILSDPIKRYVETMWSHRRGAAVFRQRKKGHTQAVCPCSKWVALPEWCWFLLHQGCDLVHTGNPASLIFGFSSLCLYPSHVSYFLLTFKLDLSTLRINMSLTPVSQVSMTAHVSCSALLTDHLTSAQTLVVIVVTDWAGICFRTWPEICFKAIQFPLFIRWNHNG